MFEVDQSAERVARGRRTAVMLCAGCHEDAATGALTGKRMVDAPPKFGTIYALAAIVGISDVDPFVLNLAQGGVTGMEDAALAAAILIAASSNNILKAAYAAGFAGGRATAANAAALVALAIAGSNRVMAFRTLAGASGGIQPTAS